MMDNGPISNFLDGVERDVEASMRPEWERRWRNWWTDWKGATPAPVRDVMEWVVTHHCDSDPFDHEAEAALDTEAPARGDWGALRSWCEATLEKAGNALEEGRLGARPEELPAPPFMPAEDDLADLTDGADRTPEGVARAYLAHVGHVARHHHRFLQTHD